MATAKPKSNANPVSVARVNPGHNDTAALTQTFIHNNYCRSPGLNPTLNIFQLKSQATFRNNAKIFKL